MFRIALQNFLSTAATAVAIAASALPFATPAGATNACTVSVGAEDLFVSVGRLDFTLGYPSPSILVVGSGEDVSCSSLATDIDDDPVVGTFNDDDAGTVTVSLASDVGFPGFGAFVLCNFVAGFQPATTDFSVSVSRADDPEGVPVEGGVSAFVTGVDCGGAATTTTTTTSTTTTMAGGSTTTTTLAGGPACGDPDGSGGAPTASDSLFVLRVSVGLGTCVLSVCDVDDSGFVTASDALRILRFAVGLDESLDCPV